MKWCCTICGYNDIIALSVEAQVPQILADDDYYVLDARHEVIIPTAHCR